MEMKLGIVSRALTAKIVLYCLVLLIHMYIFLLKQMNLYLLMILRQDLSQERLEE